MKPVDRDVVRIQVVAVLLRAHPPSMGMGEALTIPPPEYLPVRKEELGQMRWRFNTEGIVECAPIPDLTDRIVDTVIAEYEQCIEEGRKGGAQAYERAATIAVQFALGEERVVAAARLVFDRWFAEGQKDEGRELDCATAHFPMTAYEQCVKCCIRYGYRPDDDRLAIAARRLLHWQAAHEGGERVAETLAWLHANHIPGCSYAELYEDDPALAEVLRSPDPIPVPGELQRFRRKCARREAALKKFYADPKIVQAHRGRIAIFVAGEFVGSVERGDEGMNELIFTEWLPRMRAVHPEFADEPDGDLCLAHNVLTEEEAGNAALGSLHYRWGLSVKPRPDP